MSGHASTETERTPASQEHELADDDAKLIGFFDRLGAALSKGDARAIASAWAAPALVVDDAGVVAVHSVDEVEKFFAGAHAQ